MGWRSRGGRQELTPAETAESSGLGRSGGTKPASARGSPPRSRARSASAQTPEAERSQEEQPRERASEKAFSLGRPPEDPEEEWTKDQILYTCPQYLGLCTDPSPLSASLAARKSPACPSDAGRKRRLIP